MLFYVKAGGAWSDQKITLSDLGEGLFSGSATRTGWTIGTGLEHMFAPNWSVKIEYDYYDFGNKSMQQTGESIAVPGAFSSNISSKLTVNTIKAGVNYHFNLGDVAADVPVRYTKVPAPVLTWGGFYVGVEAGGTSSRDTWSLDDGSTFGSADGSGAIGGGVIGYNWQLPNNLVLGIEGNFDAADIKGTSACNDSNIVECHSKLDSLYSATGRIGYGALGPMLFYVKGGGAWTDQKMSFSDAGAFAENGSATRTGWTVGTGFEYMFAANWSAKFEYDYYDFGNKSVQLTGLFFGEPNSDNFGSKLTVNTIKAGVNYHFNSSDLFGPKF
jgi:opacity protein-like surface antigen